MRNFLIASDKPFTTVGADGLVAGVTAADEIELVEVPTLFVAVTVTT